MIPGRVSFSNNDCIPRANSREAKYNPIREQRCASKPSDVRLARPRTPIPHAEITDFDDDSGKLYNTSIFYFGKRPVLT